MAKRALIFSVTELAKLLIESQLTPESLDHYRIDDVQLSWNPEADTVRVEWNAKNELNVILKSEIS